MATKKSWLGTLATLGAVAATAAVVYYKRKELRALAEDVIERCRCDEEKWFEDEKDEADDEAGDIVIDVTVEPAQTQEKEENGEA